MSLKNHCGFWCLCMVLQEQEVQFHEHGKKNKKYRNLLLRVSRDVCCLFAVQVPRVICRRKARGARRKALTVMAGHRQRSSGHRHLLAPLTVDPTHQWPGCAQVLTCKSDSHACSSTLNPCPELLETDPARTPDSSLGTAVPLPSATATPLRPTMPTTGSPFHKVPLIPQQLSSSLCSKGGRITPPPRRRPKLLRMAQSGRTGKGSGGKSGSCCPQKTLTRCPKLWCDPHPKNLSVSFVLSLLPHLEQHGVVYMRSCFFSQTFHPRTTNSCFVCGCEAVACLQKKKKPQNLFRTF